MTTEADRNLEIARAKVREAIKSLSAIVVDECSGTDDLGGAFRSQLKDSLNKLVDVREAISR